MYKKILLLSAAVLGIIFGAPAQSLWEPKFIKNFYTGENELTIVHTIDDHLDAIYYPGEDILKLITFYFEGEKPFRGETDIDILIYEKRKKKPKTLHFDKIEVYYRDCGRGFYGELNIFADTFIMNSAEALGFEYYDALHDKRETVTIDLEGFKEVYNKVIEQ